MDSSITYDKENPSSSFLTVWYTTVLLQGYMSFYNALVEINQQNKNKDIRKFIEFANSSILKDFAILLEELYNFVTLSDPKKLDNEFDKNPQLKIFLKFTEDLRNQMHFYPSKKDLNKILQKNSNCFPNIFNKYTNNFEYYCGYFLGENVIFGSNLYTDYMLLKSEKSCKNSGDLFLFTSSIVSI